MTNDAMLSDAAKRALLAAAGGVFAASILSHAGLPVPLGFALGLLASFKVLFLGADPPEDRGEDDPEGPSSSELDLQEALAVARSIALRDGEKELAAALQAVLLLHLTGGSLVPIAGMVAPEPAQDVVN